MLLVTGAAISDHVQVNAITVALHTIILTKFTVQRIVTGLGNPLQTMLKRMTALRTMLSLKAGCCWWNMPSTWDAANADGSRSGAGILMAKCMSSDQMRSINVTGMLQDDMAVSPVTTITGGA